MSGEMEFSTWGHCGKERRLRGTLGKVSEEKRRARLL